MSGIKPCLMFWSEDSFSTRKSLFLSASGSFTPEQLGLSLESPVRLEMQVSVQVNPGAVG